MDIKKQAAQKKITEVKKPFLTGSITDENTFKSSVKFLGLLIMIIFVAFIACSSAAFGSDILRIGLNSAVIIVILMLMYLNDYSFKKTLGILVLTLFTVLITVCLLFVIYVLLTQLINFISGIYGEVVYRFVRRT